MGVTSLVSNDKKLRVIKAAAAQMHCTGDGNKRISRQAHSPLCDGSIHLGDVYVARLYRGDTPSPGLPEWYDVASRHCLHCALMFFPHVEIAEIEECENVGVAHA